jgi:hypothetical protein
MTHHLTPFATSASINPLSPRPMPVRPLLLFLLLTLFVRAEPVNPPIERVLSDEFERTIDARIVGVTAETIEVVRVADQARFSLPLKKLSEADRVFAAALLKKIVESRPLPDTPLVAAIRRDFQVFDPAKKNLVPVDPKAYATARVFVIGIQHLHDPEHAFASRLNARDAIPDQAPVLWISVTSESSVFALSAEKLPDGHAILGYKAQENALAQGRAVQTEFMNGWFKRNRPDPFADGGMTFKPSDKERADLLMKLARAMPPYWTDYAANFDTGETGGRSYPRFVALHRDGTPVKFRGAPLAGTLKIVMTVLRDNASELE